jgi:hypothetical protein
LFPPVSVRARFAEGADEEEDDDEGADEEEEDDDEGADEEEEDEEAERAAAVVVVLVAMKPAGISHEVAPVLALNQYALLCELLKSSAHSDLLLPSIVRLVAVLCC